MKRLALALLLLLGIAHRAVAVNGTTVDSISVIATAHNIGIRVYFSGDDDSDAVIIGSVRHIDQTAWDTLAFYRSTKYSVATVKRYWATSIMMCGAESLFVLGLSVTDADAPGCANCPAQAFSGETRRITTGVNYTTERLVKTMTGKQVWMGPYGDDGNSGLDAGHPKMTFAAALSLLSHPGDQIRMLPGTYYVMRTDSLRVNVDSKNGTGNSFYSVVGPGAIISGVDTTALNGSDWGAVNLGDGVTAYAKAFSAATYPRSVVIGDSAALFPYETFYRFKTDPTGIVSRCGAYWFTGDGDSVFVRPPSSVPNLTGRTLRVARRGSAMDLRSAFWRIDSLSFRDFGQGKDVGIANPVISVSNQGNVIENCRFEDMGRPCVGIIGIFDGPLWLRTHRNIIQKNTVVHHTFGQDWNYVGQKYLGYDKQAGLGCVQTNQTLLDTACAEVNIVFPTFIIGAGRGHIVRWNNVRGGADSFLRVASAGFEFFAGPPPTTQEVCDTSNTTVNDLDVYQNDVVNMGGDNYEPDAISGINSRIYRNTFLGGNTAINECNSRGPMYFVFNTCINQTGFYLPRGPDPNANEQRGWSIFANNTYSTRRDNAGYMWVGAQSAGQNDYVNRRFLNNIVTGGTALYYDGGTAATNEFDWNVLYQNNGLFQTSTDYGGTLNQFTLANWRVASGYSANDRVTASMQFADSTNWDWSPKSTWTDVLGAGKAISLPGINTNLRRHISPAWLINPSGSSDSLYAGAWRPGSRMRDATMPMPCATGQ